MKKLRLIHTSDTHLGDPAGHPRGDEVLSAVVAAVARLGGDALLLAGDVFDNERVSDAALARFVAQAGRLDTPVVILPGNHDLAHQSSVYRRAPFADAPGNLRVLLDPDGEKLVYPELDLEVCDEECCRTRRISVRYRECRNQPPGDGW